MSRAAIAIYLPLIFRWGLLFAGYSIGGKGDIMDNEQIFHLQRDARYQQQLLEHEAHGR
jgi:hypothetical protein